MIPFAIKLSGYQIDRVHTLFAQMCRNPLSDFGLTFDVGTGLWIDSQGDIADEDAVLSLFELSDMIYFPWLSLLNRAAGKKV